MDPRDTKVPDEHHVQRTGHWLSQDKRHHHDWMSKTISHVDKNPKELHPVLQEFRELVEGSPRLWMLFNTMFEQVPRQKEYLTDPTGQTSTVRDFDHLLALLNHVITTAPAWTDAGHSVGLVGVPINALLDWPMGTPAGFAVFQDPTVNAQLKKVLDVWNKFLATPESAKVLGTDKEGWFGETGKKSLEHVGNLGKTHKKFEDMFICDPNAEHHGYKSWDDFFTRHLKEGHRPIAEPDNDDIIANACESKTYKVAKNVAKRSLFWMKGQRYSVMDMLSHHPDAEQYVGGTVYQAFLSALSYHRWHVPVSGTIKQAYVVPGSYFSEPLYDDFSATQGADKAGENTSQEYLTVMATRAIVFIEADNPKIGTMVFQGIGMTEVSTCEITVKEGQKVKKGDPLGTFHFGGSTWCAMFRKGVQLEDFPEPGAEFNVPVRGQLCRVV